MHSVDRDRRRLEYWICLALKVLGEGAVQEEGKAAHSKGNKVPWKRTYQFLALGTLETLIQVPPPANTTATSLIIAIAMHPARLHHLYLFHKFWKFLGLGRMRSVCPVRQHGQGVRGKMGDGAGAEEEFATGIHWSPFRMTSMCENSCFTMSFQLLQ